MITQIKVILKFSKESIHKGVNELGHAYLTYHQTIPYEVFTDNPIDSTRVNSIEEAKEWLNNRSIMQNFTPVVDRIVNWE